MEFSRQGSWSRLPFPKDNTKDFGLSKWKDGVTISWIEKTVEEAYLGVSNTSVVFSSLTKKKKGFKEEVTTHVKQLEHHQALHALMQG